MVESKKVGSKKVGSLNKFGFKYTRHKVSPCIKKVTHPENPSFNLDSKWGWGRNKCIDLLTNGECGCFIANEINRHCVLCGKLVVPDDCINDIDTYTHTSCFNKQSKEFDENETNDVRNDLCKLSSTDSGDHGELGLGAIDSNTLQMHRSS